LIWNFNSHDVLEAAECQPICDQLQDKVWLFFFMQAEIHILFEMLSAKHIKEIFQLLLSSIWQKSCYHLFDFPYVGE